MASLDDTDQMDEFIDLFIKSMDAENMLMIDSLILTKNKDPRFPLDINQCALLAATRGNSTVLSKLLPLRPRMSFQDCYSRRAIHYAAKNGHLECVRILLKAGAINNCSDSLGHTPLHLACLMGHLEIVSLLIQQCAHINSCRTELGENAVHVTATKGYVELMELLLENGGEINMTTRISKGGETPLHKAVAADRLEMLLDSISLMEVPMAKSYREHSSSSCQVMVNLLVQKMEDIGSVDTLQGRIISALLLQVDFLLSRGAKPNIADAHGKYPVHVACERGLLRCLSILIEHGSPLEVKDVHGQTPLVSAIIENQTEVVKVLIAHGADIHVQDSSGYTPLHKTTTKSNLELIDHLVMAGADINARALTNLHTPVMTAVSMGKLEAVKKLICLGADVTLADAKGQTVLHLAHLKIGGDSVDKLVQVLLEGGGQLETRDDGNCTPLQRGLIVGVMRRTHSLPCIQLFCEAGAVLGPDAFNKGKKSPLFWLAYSGFLREALYLVRAGWELRDELWIILPGKDERQDRLHKFMAMTFRTVPSLLECSRKVVRSHLQDVRYHTEIMSSIAALPVPDPLKQYLLLRDIDVDDDSVLGID